MRYYVASDIHGYFSELKKALTEKGFFTDTEPHKLIICGDIYDRGSEALKLQDFILDLLSKDEIILIRGNHEDLFSDLLKNWNNCSYLQMHHHSNGAIDTICQLTDITVKDILSDPQAVYNKISNNPYVKTIIPSMIDYYETEHYIFTHGWIPCAMIGSNYAKTYHPIENWRDSGKEDWDRARWINGMEAAHNGITEKDKTIICGHWHCSFGHSRYENGTGEFDDNADFTPYYGDGIIAIDGCTSASGVVNCIVVED